MWHLRASICFLAALLSAGAAAGQGFSDKAIDKAIKDGAKFLWTARNADGSFPPHNAYKIGNGVLAAYALLESGVNPQEPRMAKTLKWLARTKTNYTYCLGLRCQVWLSAYRKTHTIKYRRLLAKDVDILVKSTKDGSYSYISKGLKQSSGDHSNSQYGLLGVWAGAMANLEGIPSEYWKKVLKHWQQSQCADGGWQYSNAKGGTKGTGNMTAAGVASYFVCVDNLYFAEYRKCTGKGLPKGLERGIKWFERNFARAPLASGYFLYGVERVGLACGLKYFGTADWYKLGATSLLKRQAPDGSFPVGYGKTVGTSFAMLFLIHGRHPVLFNKLQRPGDWRNRPRELAALTRWLSVDREKPVNWQIINLKVPVEEWHDAPILYISGCKVPIFTDKELDKLRTFVWQGGTLFTVSECTGPEFRKGIREVYAKLFPKYELQQLQRKHPLYSAHYPLKSKPRFFMISNGIRPLAIHCDRDLALEWQLNRYSTRPWAFQAGANVFSYVTDKGQLRSRGVKHWPDEQEIGSSIKLARLKYAGHWNPEPLAYERFSRMMADETGVGVEVLDGVPIAKLAGSGAGVAVLTGTTALKLTNQEKRQLKAFVTGGGTLLIEAGGGSKTFNKSARTLLDEMFGFDALESLASSHPIFRIKNYKILKVSYRRQARKRLGRKRESSLRGVDIKGRLAVIYSREDITTGLLGIPASQCDGYAPKSAFAILRNVLLHVVDQGIKKGDLVRAGAAGAGAGKGKPGAAVRGDAIGAKNDGRRIPAQR